jgi:chemotaxis protein CheD
MTTEHSSVAATDRIKVGVAGLAVSTDATRITTSGLGSCVGIAIADTEANVAGLAHAMLPSTSGNASRAKPAKVVSEGIEQLLTEMESAGADRDRVEAKLAGGSRMLDFSGVGEAVGERNVERARTVFTDLGVPVVAEDVGGSHGRSLVLHPVEWTLTVTSAHEGVLEL